MSHSVSRRAWLYRMGAIGCFAIAASLFVPQAKSAQSHRFVRDAQIETFLSRVLGPIVSPLGYVAKDFRFVILQDPSPNAFVIGGSAIFIHTGLLRLMPDVGALQAALAHEFAHYHAGHNARLMGRHKESLLRILAGSLVAIPIALLTKRADATAGALMAAQGASQLDVLRYTRDLESEADYLAAEFLEQASIHPNALVRSLENLLRHARQQTESRQYTVTHPLTSQRLQRAKLLAAQSGLPYRSDTIPCTSESGHAQPCQFQLIKGKLRGFLDSPREVYERHKNDNSPYGRIAASVAAMRLFNHMAALDRADGLRRDFPEEAYIHELYGDIAAHGGIFNRANESYLTAIELDPENTLLRYSWLRNINTGSIAYSVERLESEFAHLLARKQTMIPLLQEVARFYHRAGEPHLRELYLAEAALLLGRPQEAKNRLSDSLGSFQKKNHRQRAADIMLQAEQLISS